MQSGICSPYAAKVMVLSSFWLVL